MYVKKTRKQGGLCSTRSKMFPYKKTFSIMGSVGLICEWGLGGMGVVYYLFQQTGNPMKTVCEQLGCVPFGAIRNQVEEGCSTHSTHSIPTVEVDV